MPNIKLIIAYEGTDYLGWQKTKEGKSIEETLESAIAAIIQQPIVLNAASRTDAGVHARGQTVHFLCQKDAIEIDRLLLGINSRLPEDIVVLSAQTVHQDFHATMDCKGKEYHYEICTARFQDPRERRYCWHYPYLLDVPLMRRAAELLHGEHDFQSLCNMRKQLVYSDTIRRIERIEIVENGEGKILFRIAGNHFLYKMARNIAGLLAYAGRGLIAIEEVRTILQSRDRTKAAITAPAHGLTLHRVIYA